jgi:hypothetical protein
MSIPFTLTYAYTLHTIILYLQIHYLTFHSINHVLFIVYVLHVTISISRSYITQHTTILHLQFMHTWVSSSNINALDHIFLLHYTLMIHSLFYFHFSHCPSVRHIPPNELHTYKPQRKHFLLLKYFKKYQLKYIPYSLFILKFTLYQLTIRLLSYLLPILDLFRPAE